jgi:hypothetical protein
VRVIRPIDYIKGRHSTLAARSMSIALCNIARTDELCFVPVARVQMSAGPGLVRVHIFEIENGSLLEAGQGRQFILLVIALHQL